MHVDYRTGPKPDRIKRIEAVINARGVLEKPLEVLYEEDNHVFWVSADCDGGGPYWAIMSEDESTLIKLDALY